MTPLFDPRDHDVDRIASQWIAADRLAKTHAGEPLDKTLRDLDRLQQVLDAGALEPTDSYELQCLGIALGRVLASTVDGLDWAVVDDEYGRDPTIRYRQTSFQVNVLTIISKRIESGDAVDVRAIYDWVTSRVDAFKNEVE